MDEFQFDEPGLPEIPDNSTDDEETDDEEELGLLSLSEHAAWIAGAIGRHYERTGLISTHDEFTAEWHELFNQEWLGISETDFPDSTVRETGEAGEGPGTDFGTADFGGWGDFGGFDFNF